MSSLDTPPSTIEASSSPSTSSPPPSSAQTSSGQKYQLPPPPKYHKRGSPPNYTNLWPIALAPAIPLIGMAFKKQAKVRNALIGVFGVSILFYAHHSAMTTSKDITG